MYRPAAKRQVHLHVPAHRQAAGERRAARERPVSELLRRPPAPSQTRRAGRSAGSILLALSGEEECAEGLLFLRRNTGRARLGILRGADDAHGGLRGLHHRFLRGDAVSGDRDADARPGALLGDVSVLVQGVPRFQGSRRRRSPVRPQALARTARVRRVLGDRRLPGGRRTRAPIADQDPPGVLGRDAVPRPRRAPRPSRIPVRSRIWPTGWWTTPRPCTPSTGSRAT